VILISEFQALRTDNEGAVGSMIEYLKTPFVNFIKGYVYQMEQVNPAVEFPSRVYKRSVSITIMKQGLNLYIGKSRSID